MIVNGVRLHPAEHASGAPILCIHGTSGSAALWGDAVQELARLGRVISYDRRGCGRSERPEPYERTNVGEHADDAARAPPALREAVEALSGAFPNGRTVLVEGGHLIDPAHPVVLEFVARSLG